MTVPKSTDLGFSPLRPIQIRAAATLPPYSRWKRGYGWCCGEGQDFTRQSAHPELASHPCVSRPSDASHGWL